MPESLCCYRCGASLEALTLPFSRRDECPECENYLHVCLMCEHYDPQVPKQCREDDAEEVTDKRGLNFCDYFRPGTRTFDAGRRAAEESATAALGALFGDDEPGNAEPDAQVQKAENLFK